MRVVSHYSIRLLAFTLFASCHQLQDEGEGRRLSLWKDHIQPDHLKNGEKLTESMGSGEKRFQLFTGRMRKAVPVCHVPSWRRFIVPLMVMGLISLGILKLPMFNNNPKPVMMLVDPHHREKHGDDHWIRNPFGIDMESITLPSNEENPLVEPSCDQMPKKKFSERVHSFVRSVLARECRPSFTRRNIERMYSSSVPVAEPFLQKNSNLTEQIFEYPPPFGFRDLQHKLKEVLDLIPSSLSENTGGHDCRRCVVVGNGGILRGLELGPLLNQFNVILRLNSGPVRDFSRDVGNRTTIRMSYPEGSPKIWEDVDPQLQFVAVIYKAVDFNWLHAMISRTTISLWDKLFFWQKVPGSIPVDPSKFRLLNPEIIRETALELLHYPNPKPRQWGWDQKATSAGKTLPFCLQQWP
ncbi:lactosylceramide alpha-2,3-sialyltransferase isoform X4 [Pangasianodon hypophthalmus]|uniref:lactosylceramide alpha-2,3-sialyltransferase isoform X4 n=1 Tax=Pangasianodon hypophthalmus TaxID=310915 RepID=UPI000EFFC071|nr:lactosylceramide alpha-2,3-sialyltransferase isoform X4 [Pangasianodon hypophthalmus]